MINVADDHLAIIKKILHKHVPQCEVRAFGSRLTDNVKSYSDLDLAVVGEKKIERKIMVELKEAFEESIIPFRIDLLDWHRISDGFKKIIQKNYIVIQPTK